MISSKLDEVSRNSIWEEHCKKETRRLTLNTHFSISDPRRMAILPEKPNRVIPAPNPDPSTVLSASRELHDLCNVKDIDKLPPDKYPLPITGNQEYGFFRQTLGGTNPMFQYPRRRCDVTEYADAYTSMGGSSPFARKDPASGA